MSAAWWTVELGSRKRIKLHSRWISWEKETKFFVWSFIFVVLLLLLVLKLELEVWSNFERVI